MSAWSGPSGWINPAVKPLPYDPEKADQILDSLGYRGARTASAGARDDRRSTPSPPTR